MLTDSGLPGWFPGDFKTDPALLSAFEDGAAWHAPARVQGRGGSNRAAAGQVKDLAAAITSATGREGAVRNHLAVAEAAIEDGDTKTAYGALDMARRHALGEFGANPDRPVQLEDKTEAWRPIIRLRDSVRATAPRDA